MQETHTPSEPAGAADRVAANQPTSASQSLDTILQQLKDQLATQQAEASTANKLAKSLQEDVNQLERVVREVRTAAGAYKAARVALAERREKLEHYRTSMRKLIEAALGDDGKARVDGAIKWLEDRLSHLPTEIEQSRQQLDARKADSQKAASALERARHDYDDAQNRHTVIDAELRALERLRNQIDSAEKELDWDKAYATLGELDRQFQEVNKKLVDEARSLTLLEEAWRQVSAAQEQVRSADQATQQAQEAHDKKRRELDEMQADRVGAVLHYLKEPPAAEPAGAAEKTAPAAGSAPSADHATAGTTQPR